MKPPYLLTILLLLALAAIAFVVIPLFRKPKKKPSPVTIPRTSTAAAADIPKGPIPDSELHRLVERLLQPGLLLEETPNPTGSYLGGLPPSDLVMAWPRRKNRPLAFLACIRLADTGETLPWLPRQGRLLFFCDLDDTPWGFDPADRDGWQVIHLPGDASPDGGFATVPADLKKEYRLPAKPVRFEETSLPPDVEHPLFDPVELTDAQSDWLAEKRTSISGEDSGHQIGSYAFAVQDADMEMQCQLVSNGLYVGDTTGYHDPRAADLQAGAADWRLLLQIDSDDDLGLMWGDLGTVYFWIREQDARAGDFSRTWMILQCH